MKQNNTTKGMINILNIFPFTLSYCEEHVTKYWNQNKQQHIRISLKCKLWVACYL